MIELQELRFSGIGRIVEEQVIDFTKLGKLVQVDGKNCNTNGSSGAGKTTIFNALDFLLGLNDIPTTILQSRLTKDPITVTGKMLKDGKTIVIQRGKKLSVDIDGDITIGSNKLAEEKIDQMLGMPRTQVRCMIHKRQGEGGFFLNFTPKDTHEFLMDCLGHSHFRAKLELLDKRVKELTDKETLLKNKVESNKAALKATQDAILALGSPPVKDMHQETVLALKAKLDASVAALEEIKKRHASEREAVTAIRMRHRVEWESLELNKPKPSATPYDFSVRTSMEKELSSLRNETQTLISMENARQMQVGIDISKLKMLKASQENDVRKAKEAAVRAITIAEEIKKIRASMCPTCEQSWSNDQAKAREALLIEQLKKIKEEIVYGKAQELSIAKLDQSIAQLTEDLKPRVPEGLDNIKKTEQQLLFQMQLDKDREKDHNAAQNNKISAQLGGFAESQAQMSAKHTKELQDADPSVRHSFEVQQFSGQVDLDRRAFEASLAKLKAYEDAKTRYVSSHSYLKGQEKTTLDTLAEAQLQLSSVTKDLEVASELKKAVKSYTSCSFDDALEEIGEAATRLIRGIPNMANATIQLQGVKETKEGKIKEEVNAIINLDAEIAIPIKSLSGGERSSVDLAIDLAVIDLLENKTGKGMDVFILDEPFTGLDTVSIEMALEVLKNSNLNKRLIVVDHNPIIKETISDRVVVVREGETSRIEVA
jgi:DNA repair exonuclease SbcCD ATPase subunit